MLSPASCSVSFFLQSVQRIGNLFDRTFRAVATGLWIDVAVVQLLVDQGYLDSLTLEKYENMAYRWPENLLIAKDHERVVGFAAFGD